MKHITKERTCADAMLELEQLRDGSMPPENTPALANPVYARAHDRFLHEGNVTNTLREGADNEGGYLVPDTFECQIVQAMTEQNVMRRLCTVVQTERTMKFPVAKGFGPADWVPEEGVIPVTEGEFDEVRLEAHKVATTIRVSDELLEDCGFNLEDFLASQFASRIASAEEHAFLYGDGKAKPLGLLHQLDREVTTEKPGQITVDDLIELIHAIPRPYCKGGCAADERHDPPRTLQAGGRRRQPHLVREPQKRIPAGDPQLPCRHQPGHARHGGGKAPILFGNFRHFVIGDRQHRRIKRLNEVYAQQGQVAYIMSQRVDAKLLDRNAIAALKVK